MSDNNNRRIDYIELPTTDITAAKQFYGQAFGWSFVDYGEHYTSFEDGRLAGGFNPELKVADKGGALVVIFALDLVSCKINSLN